MDIRTETRDDWSELTKGVFVTVCCVSGAGFAASPCLSPTPQNDAPPITAVGTMLLAGVFVAAFRVGVSGKASASWAVLAFGSWMTMLLGMFFFVVWYACDTLATSWWGYLLALCFIAFLGVRGLCAAVRDEWGRMGAWWLATFVLLFFLAPQVNYAPYFARVRREKRAMPIPARTLPTVPQERH